MCIWSRLPGRRGCGTVSGIRRSIVIRRKIPASSPVFIGGGKTRNSFAVRSFPGWISRVDRSKLRLVTTPSIESYRKLSDDVLNSLSKSHCASRKNGVGEWVAVRTAEGIYYLLRRSCLGYQYWEEMGRSHASLDGSARASDEEHTMVEDTLPTSMLQRHPSWCLSTDCSRSSKINTVGEANDLIQVPEKHESDSGLSIRWGCSTFT